MFNVERLSLQYINFFDQINLKGTFQYEGNFKRTYFAILETLL